jgi:hypothetical protein
VRHATDLGYLPVVVAAQRSLEGLAFAGGSLQTDVATICPMLRRVTAATR